MSETASTVSADPMPAGTVPANKIAWFHPVSGIAGDMALGALLDAGANLDYVRSVLAGLDVPGWELTAELVKRGGLAATKAVVTTEEQHHHRRWSDIRELLAAADFASERIRQRAQYIFERLAIAEAEVHGIEPNDVHFHEVGALDAIVDIVGVAAALESLGIDQVGCGPVSVGKGQIIAEHGALPNPAPAVVRLLEGFEITGVDVDFELTTPTGAAIVAALAGATNPLPPLTLRASGYGAGTADLDNRPNVTQVIIGEQTPAASSDDLGAVGTTTTLTELSTNLDDVTGEVLSHATAALIDAGALDAWVMPIVMKKGRPAHCLHVLCSPALAPMLTQTVMSLTGTLGVRAATVLRTAVPRSQVVVDVDGQPVSTKLGPHRAKAEWGDAERAAQVLGVAPMVVAQRAESAATEQTTEQATGQAAATGG